MARRSGLPENLSPSQVVALQDALLANADRLLRAASAMVEDGDVGLSRSLAILGMEESGKAIALHRRRVAILSGTEGEPFVNSWLKSLWSSHTRKLAIVYDFLVWEQYGFSDSQFIEENESVLGEIDDWKRHHNEYKQRGFYVDIGDDGQPKSPADLQDADAVLEAISHIHQIGWQLRLGEHIEGRRQEQRQEGMPPATEDQIDRMRHILERTQHENIEESLDRMRRGSKGEQLANIEYGFLLPEKPFENVGRPGYEAQDRELHSLFVAIHGDRGETDPDTDLD